MGYDDDETFTLILNTSYLETAKMKMSTKFAVHTDVTMGN